MAVSLMHPAIMFWGTAIIVILGGALAWALSRYFKSRRKPFLALAVALVLPISGLGVLEYVVYRDFQYQLHYDILQYTVTLESSSILPEAVFLPASSNERLTGLVKVASGNATLSVADTIRGRCLGVNFTGHVRLSGRLDTTGGVGTHDLTMVSNLSQKHYIRLHWICYAPANASSFNCSIALALYHQSLDWWETSSFSGFLNSSWHEYAFEHEGIS